MSLLLARVALAQPEQPEQIEQPSGGFGAWDGYVAAKLRKQARERKDRLWTDEDEAELGELLRAIPEKSPEERELERIRALVADYASDAQREFLTRRGQRAVEYAQRAQTSLALQLAAREIERFEEDAIAAVLAIALAD